MKRRTIALAIGSLSIAALALVLYPLAGALAQQHGGGSGPGNGNKPPSGEESATNLSYPAYFYGTPLQTGSIGITPTLDAKFPEGVSYGCAIPEIIGTTTYPNTSCVTSTGTPLSYEDCKAVCNAKDPSKSIDRIYWQKNINNKWQAGYAQSTDAGGTALALSVKYVDWGDNLESKSWPIQVIRVETNTFSTLPESPDTTVAEGNPRLRYEVWHVRGQGTDELWGLHTTNPETAEESPVAYAYLDDSGGVNWEYGVNVVNVPGAGARLNLAKLAAGFPVGGCPATYTPQTTYNPVWVSIDGVRHWAYVNNSTTNLVPYEADLEYGAELNIKGSYVYGYNWNLRSAPVPETVGKAGWWRLTFYTPNNSIVFNDWTEPTLTDNTLAPPPNISVGLVPSGTEGLIEPTADTGMLYVPIVDKANQLTYIDICVTEGKGSGGGRKGR